MNCLINLACIYLIIWCIFLLMLTPYIILWMFLYINEVKIEFISMGVFTWIWVYITLSIINKVYTTLTEIRNTKNFENSSIEVVHVNVWDMNSSDSTYISSEEFPVAGDITEV
jgi:hypothetical protein